MSVGTDNSSLASSLTDLMTSLAVIFVLLLVASLNNMGQKGVQTRDQMVLQLKQALREFAGEGVTVKNDDRDPLGLLVLVPEGLLQFAFDKSDISPQGVEFLRRFAPRLSETVCSARFRREIHSIIVEGHADSLGTDKANLERSQQRSLQVAMTSLNVLDALEQEDSARPKTRECFMDFVSATGRGSRDPVRDMQGREDKDRSRRVVFKIRVRSIEQRDLREIIGGVQTPATAR